MKVERIYMVPLRDAYETVSYKRTPRAVKILREFVIRHMKAHNGEKVSLSKALNEFLWMRSIKKPPRRVKVRIIKDGAAVNVYLADEKSEDKKKEAPIVEAKKEDAKKEVSEAQSKPTVAETAQEPKKITSESKPAEKKVVKSEKK